MDSGDPKWENEALPERISTLDAAILRISATLDLDTVSAAAVESACRPYRRLQRTPTVGA